MVTLRAPVQNDLKHCSTDVVNYGVMEHEARMARKSQGKPQTEMIEETSVRASISFPGELYRTLEEIARQKKVSLAWVVRDATEQYVSDKWPLFKGQG